MRLYELSENYNNLYELLDNEEVPIEVIEEALAGIEDELENKFDSTAALVKAFEGKVKIFKEEEKRLNERRKVYENRVKWLKDYMLNQLEFIDRTKIEGNRFTIRKQKSPSGVSVDETVLPEEFFIPQPPKVDLKTIRERLKNGEEIEGAGYKPDSYHIRIQ